MEMLIFMNKLNTNVDRLVELGINYLKDSGNRKSLIPWVI